MGVSVGGWAVQLPTSSCRGHLDGGQRGHTPLEVGKSRFELDSLQGSLPFWVEQL